MALAPTAEADGKTGLVLSIRGTQLGTLESTQLKCDPPGGKHTNAAAACRDLTTAGGDFSKLPGDPDLQFCTMEFQPVKASARGRWQGKPVSWSSAEYPNRCSMNAALGVVFRF
ncbi:protease [Lentzea sp. NBRC 105346]|nr:protease [Lentzea sp. NBRC 105346]